MENGDAKESLKLKEDKPKPHQNDVTNTFDDLDRGWAWMVMFACFGAFCLIGGSVYAVGIIHSTLLERYNESLTLTSWVGATHSALTSAGGPIASAVIDRYSCRAAIMGAGFLYVIGYLATVFAPNLKVAMLTCGIIAGFGGALGYTSCVVVVGFNFQRHRSLAMGLSLSGIGVGLFVMAPIMQISRDFYGSSGFFLILAALMANVVTFGALCYPSKLELHAQRKRQHETQTRVNKSKHCPGLRNYFKVISNKAVLCLCFSMFNFCLGTLLIYLHLPEYIKHKGFSSHEASYIVSISGILCVFGRIFTGIAASWDKLSEVIIYSSSMTLVSIATMLFPWYSGNFIGQVVYAVILGLFFGSCYVVITAVNIKVVGVDYMASALGLEFGFGGIGALIGPVMAGMIVDSGGTYDQSFIVAGFCILLSACLGAATVCFPNVDKDIDTRLNKEWEITDRDDQYNCDTMFDTKTENIEL